jgi:hypothetical protein
MKYLLPALFLSAWMTFSISPAHGAPKGNTLDDLKKLDIICLVPRWLPDGYHLKTVDIDYSDRDESDNPKARSYAAYSTEYGDGKKGRFTIESARWGIGDRNLDQDDRAEEAQFETKRYGTVYIIYFPPGKAGVKKRIAANWIEDENLVAENKESKTALPVKGRFHGFSGYGMTVVEFTKIVQSLHPIREK